MKYRTNHDFLEKLALLMDADTLEWMMCKDKKRVRGYGERVKGEHRYFTGLTLKALGYRPLARHLMKLYEEFKHKTLEYPVFFTTLQMILANKFNFIGLKPHYRRLTEERVERQIRGFEENGDLDDALERHKKISGQLQRDGEDEDNPMFL